VGFAGAALSSFGGDLVQRLLAALAGTLMIIFAMNLTGLLPDPLRRLGLWASRKTGLALLARRVATEARASGWYALGLANGLLPCGLVYAALSLALATGNAMHGVVMMLCFGLGTIPAMMAVPSLLSRLTPAMRSSAMRVAGMLLFALGVMTLWRGFMPMHHM